MLQIMCLRAFTRNEQVAACLKIQAIYMNKQLCLVATEIVWANLLLRQAVLVELNQRAQELRVCHHRLGARPADVLQIPKNDHTLAHLADLSNSSAFIMRQNKWHEPGQASRVYAQTCWRHAHSASAVLAAVRLAVRNEQGWRS